MAVESHLMFNTNNGNWERVVGYSRSSTIKMVFAKDDSGSEAKQFDVQRTPLILDGLGSALRSGSTSD